MYKASSKTEEEFKTLKEAVEHCNSHLIDEIEFLSEAGEVIHLVRYGGDHGGRFVLEVD